MNKRHISLLHVFPTRLRNAYAKEYKYFALKFSITFIIENVTIETEKHRQTSLDSYQ